MACVACASLLPWTSGNRSRTARRAGIDREPVDSGLRRAWPGDVRRHAAAGSRAHVHPRRASRRERDRDRDRARRLLPVPLPAAGEYHLRASLGRVRRRHARSHARPRSAAARLPTSRWCSSRACPQPASRGPRAGPAPTAPPRAARGRRGVRAPRFTARGPLPGAGRDVGRRGRGTRRTRPIPPRRRCCRPASAPTRRRSRWRSRATDDRSRRSTRCSSGTGCSGWRRPAATSTRSPGASRRRGSRAPARARRRGSRAEVRGFGPGGGGRRRRLPRRGLRRLQPQQQATGLRLLHALGLALRRAAVLAERPADRQGRLLPEPLRSDARRPAQDPGRLRRHRRAPRSPLNYSGTRSNNPVRRVLDGADRGGARGRPLGSRHDASTTRSPASRSPTTDPAEPHRPVGARAARVPAAAEPAGLVQNFHYVTADELELRPDHAAPHALARRERERQPARGSRGRRQRGTAAAGSGRDGRA